MNILKSKLTDRIKRFGVGPLLREIIAILEDTYDENLLELSRSIKDALREYEKNRQKTSKLFGKFRKFERAEDEG